MYAHVRGDPVNRTDPSGLTCTFWQNVTYWLQPTNEITREVNYSWTEGDCSEAGDGDTIVVTGKRPRRGVVLAERRGSVPNPSPEEQQDTCSSNAYFRGALNDPDVQRAIASARSQAVNHVNPWTGHRSFAEYGFWASQDLFGSGFTPRDIYTNHQVNEITVDPNRYGAVGSWDVRTRSVCPHPSTHGALASGHSSRNQCRDRHCRRHRWWAEVLL